MTVSPTASGDALQGYYVRQTDNWNPWGSGWMRALPLGERIALHGSVVDWCWDFVRLWQWRSGNGQILATNSGSGGNPEC